MIDYRSPGLLQSNCSQGSNSRRPSALQFTTIVIAWFFSSKGTFFCAPMTGSLSPRSIEIKYEETIRI
jgi:hypothetical protein